MKRLNKLLSIILSGVAVGCLIAAAIIYVDIRKDEKEVDQVLDAFHVVPDYDLSIMKQKQTLFDITTNILNGIKEVLEQVKPDVVLYEESLDQDTIEQAVTAIYHADLLIVGGTSLTVYPAAGLIDYYSGDKLVLINRDATPFDNRADLVIHRSLGEIFTHL